MNWLKPKDEPSSKPHHHPLWHAAFNSLQTQISNIVRAIPDRFSSPVPNYRFASVSDSNSTQPNIGNGGGATADYALSEEEIKKRMAGIPVYTLSGSEGSHYRDRTCAASQYGDRLIQLYFLNKPDAFDFMEISTRPGGSRVIDAPLTEVVDFYGGEIAPIRLIPELSEVKNALQVRKKHIADGTFGGVPVFQSDRLIVKGKGDSHKYRPAFLRKEDLETALAKTIAPNKRGIIQVAALEDIIQEMKDCSTSKWNDVVFVAPGKNMDLDMDMAFEEER